MHPPSSRKPPATATTETATATIRFPFTLAPPSSPGGRDGEGSFEARCSCAPASARAGIGERARERGQFDGGGSGLFVAARVLPLPLGARGSDDDDGRAAGGGEGEDGDEERTWVAAHLDRARAELRTKGDDDDAQAAVERLWTDSSAGCSSSDAGSFCGAFLVAEDFGGAAPSRGGERRRRRTASLARINSLLLRGNAVLVLREERDGGGGGLGEDKNCNENNDGLRFWTYAPLSAARAVLTPARPPSPRGNAGDAPLPRVREGKRNGGGDGVEGARADRIRSALDAELDRTSGPGPTRRKRLRKTAADRPESQDAPPNPDGIPEGGEEEKKRKR